jgi:hypothetical protein
MKINGSRAVVRRNVQRYLRGASDLNGSNPRLIALPYERSEGFEAFTT